MLNTQTDRLLSKWELSRVVKRLLELRRVDCVYSANQINRQVVRLFHLRALYLVVPYHFLSCLHMLAVFYINFAPPRPRRRTAGD